MMRLTRDYEIITKIILSLIIVLFALAPVQAKASENEQATENPKLSLEASVNKNKVRSGKNFVVKITVHNNNSMSVYNNRLCSKLDENMQYVNSSQVGLWENNSICFELLEVKPQTQKTFFLTLKADKTNNHKRSFVSSSVEKTESIVRISII